MAEEIKISIGADTTNLDQKLNQAKNTISKFEAQTAKASNTLLSLGRVAQDAPFGFIAISNNLNPLIESFSRLKQESGTTGGALKALVNGLKGPDGIAIAFSLVTAAISFASMGLRAWGLENSKAAQEAKKINEELKKQKQATDAIYSALGGEASQVLTLIAVLNNENETRARKLAAIKALQNIAPDIFKNLQLEGDYVKNLNSDYDKYIQNLRSTAAVKFYQKSIEDLIAKQLQLSDTPGFEKAYKVASDQYKRNIDLSNQAKRENGAYMADLKNQYQMQIKIIDSQKKEYDQISKQIDDIVKKISTYTTSVDSKQLGLAFDKQTDKAKKQDDVIKDLIESYKDIARYSRAIGEADQTFTIPSFLNGEMIKVGGKSLTKEYELILKTIETLTKDFNMDPNNEIIVKLNKDAARIAGLAAMVEFEDALKPLSLPEVQMPTTLMTKSFEQWKKKYDKFKADQAAYVAKKEQDYANIIIGLSTDSAAQIGAVLGQGLYAAITGQSNGLISAFQGLFSLFGDAVIALGKYAIMYSTAIEALKKALVAGGVTGIAVGVGLIALGTLIKAAISGIGKNAAFAVGTRFAPGGMALVGERGPELVNIPRGSQVIPAAQTSNMMGGIGGSVEVFGVLRGQDIYFSNKKYGQTYNRQT